MKILDKKDEKAFLQDILFNYNCYLDWLDEDSDKNFYVLSTLNIRINPTEMWNEVGREIYDKPLLSDHCSKVIEILRMSKLTTFLAQHEYQQFQWIPSGTVNDKKKSEVILFLKNKLIQQDFSSFDNKLILEEETEEFILRFIDYPFLFKYRNIDLISLQADLVIKITHHLTIDFISSDKEIIYNITSLCDKVQLKYTKSKNLQ